MASAIAETRNAWGAPPAHPEALLEAWARPRALVVPLSAAALLAASALLLLLAHRPDSHGNHDARSATFSQLAPEAASALALQSLEGIGLLETLGACQPKFEERKQERLLEISGGALRAEIVPQAPERPLVIRTPHLEIAVLGTRFDLRVDAERSELSLIEGHLRITLREQTLELYAGESLRSDDPRFEISSLPPAPRRGESELHAAPAPSPKDPPRAAESMGRSLKSCEGRESPMERIACLEQVALETGLSAQTALFAIALQYRQLGERRSAIDATHRFEKRFSESFLAPEAMLLKIELLIKEARRGEAADTCDAFVKRFPSDPRSDEIAAMGREQRSLRGREPVAAPGAP